MLEVGETLQNGRYRIRKQLTQGGMGRVYLAIDHNLSEQRVAIKENLETNPATQEQFRQEAMLLARLTHPNLPRVTDHFIEPTGRQYLVMDYIDGEDLREIMQARKGPLPEAEVLPWIGKVMDALIFMHGWIDPVTGKASPIIHRDIKPGNIKRTLDGRIVLVDFGIAKYYQDDGATHISARAVTPGYSPNEQYVGGTDARSDVYALGATLYTLLTGERPPDAPALGSGLRLPEPRRRNPQISRNTERVILRAMKAQPDERYQSIQEMHAALTGARNVFGFGAKAAPVRPAPRSRIDLDKTQIDPAPVPLSTPEPAKGGGRALMLGTLLVVVALVALLVYSQLGEEQFTLSWGPSATPTLQPTATFPLLAPTATLDAAQWGTQPPANPIIGATWTDPQYDLRFLYVPAGDVTLGSAIGNPDEAPTHTVTLAGFWIMATEVTNAQYAQCVAAAQCGAPTNPTWDQPDYAQYPVTFVSWRQANRYAAWVGGRLPTEAEWEKAARGLDGRLYPWGNEWNGSRLNYCDQQCDRSWRDPQTDDGFAQAAPVGSFPPESASPYGLFDMAGNVREWTSSLWRPYPYHPLDGRENGQSNASRVVRGGFWGDRPDDVRTANRFSVQSTHQDEDVGFRVVRTAP